METKELTLISKARYETIIFNKWRNLYIIDEQTMLSIRRDFTLFFVYNLPGKSNTSTRKDINRSL